MMATSSGDLDLTDNHDSINQVSLSNQEINSVEMITNESDSGIHTAHSNQDGSPLSEIPTMPESHEEGNTPSITLKKVSSTLQTTLGHDSGVSASKSDQENFIVALRPEKGLDKLPPRRNPDSLVHAAHSDPGVTFSKLPEKPTVDGYNWRKYGQKLVKGNSLVRSYYKCTFADCPARKQVERSHDGHITETNYLWKHEHPKPPHTLLKGSAFVLPIQARGSDEWPLTTSEDNSSLHPATSHEPEASETHLLQMVAASENSVKVAVSESAEMKSGGNDIPADPKRQKRESCSISDGMVTKAGCEPRVVVQTTSAVDMVNDGYRWRKYGQKLVKGNRHPRSYYRCSSGGCPAKKHVERASHDEKVVVTTYEGRHDHEMPAGGRTVTHNKAMNNDEARPQSNTNESAGMEMVVHVSAN